jgi:hypothetical protein
MERYLRSAAGDGSEDAAQKLFVLRVLCLVPELLLGLQRDAIGVVHRLAS